MRTFIAIEIPDDVRTRVDSYMETVRPKFPGNTMKWVAPENLHFTIKFLGEVKPNELGTVRECVDAAAGEFESFRVSVDSTGFFPSENRPRVMWLGAHEGADNMLDIFQHLEHCLESEGYDRDANPFHPHLTLGRVRRNRKCTVPEDLADFEPVEFDATGLVVMKSILTPDGPVYEKQHESPLQESVSIE